MKTLAYVTSATLVIALAATAGACSASKNEAAVPTGEISDAGTDAAAPESYPVITIAGEPQRPGDPAKGYRALVNEPYVPCGIPYSAYSQVYGPAAAKDTVPGREGRNATLAYNFTSMTTKDGVETDAKAKAALYDTTRLGYSNAGHTYGDALSADDRGAVIEYLKTL